MIAATINQATQAATPTGHAAVSSTPRPVATPLPPLNPSQTGNRWPMTAPSPDHNAASGGPENEEHADRDGAFAGVEQQGRRRQPFVAGTQHIGGADVAAIRSI